jgi:hypothetical protein
MTDEVDEMSAASRVSHGDGIVARLRSWRDERGYPTPGEMLDEATAEIERLRLTDEERVDVAMWMSECLRQCSLATDGGNEEVAERWSQRAKRAAALLERVGGE